MTITELRRRINVLRQEGLSYRNVADFYGVNPGIIHSIVNKEGYEPKDPEIRKRLSLPTIANNIFVVNGKIEEGAQSRGSRSCLICGRSFVPNSPKRKRCFSCVPFRSRK